MKIDPIRAKQPVGYTRRTQRGQRYLQLLRFTAIDKSILCIDTGLSLQVSWGKTVVLV